MTLTEITLDKISVCETFIAWLMNTTSSDLKENFVLCERLQLYTISVLASCAIGLCGIFPLLFIPFGNGLSFEKEKGAKALKLLLSFAVGGLLGDVFLHLLPEAWQHLDRHKAEMHVACLQLGIWILGGIFMFVVIEMIFSSSEKEAKDPVKSSNKVYTNGTTKVQSHPLVLQNPSKSSQPIQITGYLNLLANSIDNFTHGLAVGGSFLVGTKMGLITTFAILIHEIPHEVGDFAILLRSGFNKWKAAKAQLSTASVGVLGTIFALWVNCSETMDNYTFWILPFTAGGFINIALVNILPEIIKEDDPWESLKQIVCICGGIAVMAAVSVVV